MISDMRCLFGAVVLASVIMVPASGLAQSGGGGPPAALVQVDEVVVAPLTQTFPVLGRLVARQRGEIAARVAGPVDMVPVEVGERVAKGDVLARLDLRQLELAVGLQEAQLAEAEANYHTQEANLGLAQQALERITGLQGSASFSRARFDDAQSEAARARAALTEAEARRSRARVQLDLAKLDLERAVIRAPFDGVVTIRHIQAGAFVNVGEPVVILVDDRSLEIEADVPTDRLAGLSPATDVAVRLDDGTEHRARVRALVPEENPMTRTRAVRFTPLWTETEKPLAANQTVTLDLPLGAVRDVVSVHKDAVINGPRGSIVYVVKDGQAQIRPVNLGEAAGSRLVVLSGLAPGDIVVVRGNERLRPGQPVRTEGSS